ncbi:MAG: hypothetical protein WAV47_23805, partial [Blastocatellia bacterium]
AVEWPRAPEGEALRHRGRRSRGGRVAAFPRAKPIGTEGGGAAGVEWQQEYTGVSGTEGEAHRHSGRRSRGSRWPRAPEGEAHRHSGRRSRGSRVAAGIYWR